jgi:NAD(P)-dependent dehydrogenase (short-subunit alcohol dehydrogenase family)
MHMLKSGWGRIINMSMFYATMMRRSFSPYGPSKAAFESETQIWAQELDGTDVTVTGMIPESFQAERSRIIRPLCDLRRPALSRPLLTLFVMRIASVTL